MRITVVAPSAVPFLVDGAEKLWWGCCTPETNIHRTTRR